MIKTTCVDCGKTMKAPDEYAGKKAKCPGCGAVFIVPENQVTAVQSRHAKTSVAPPMHHEPVEFQEFMRVKPPVETQVNIQNNVAFPQAASNSLGISSLVVGVLSLMICWMPVISWVIAGLGLVLGGFGIFQAVYRKGQGIGFSIAGAGLSSVCLMGWLFFFVVAANATTEVEKAREKARKQLAEDMENIFPGASKPEVKAKPAAKIYAVNAPIVVGDFQIKLTKATLGKVKIKTLMDSDSTSTEPFIRLDLEVQNISKTKKLTYSSHIEKEPFSTSVLKLEDDFGNEYDQANFGGGNRIAGAMGLIDSIYPGKKVMDAMVFELPIEAAKELILTMDAADFKQPNEEIKIRIPIGFVQKE